MKLNTTLIFLAVASIFSTAYAADTDSVSGGIVARINESGHVRVTQPLQAQYRKMMPPLKLSVRQSRRVQAIACRCSTTTIPAPPAARPMQSASSLQPDSRNSALTSLSIRPIGV